MFQWVKVFLASPVTQAQSLEPVKVEKTSFTPLPSTFLTSAVGMCYAPSPIFLKRKENQGKVQQCTSVTKVEAGGSEVQSQLDLYSKLSLRKPAGWEAGNSEALA